MFKCHLRTFLLISCRRFNHHHHRLRQKRSGLVSSSSSSPLPILSNRHSMSYYNNVVERREENGVVKKMSLQRTGDFRDLKKLLSSSASNEDGLVVSQELREGFHSLCSSFIGGAWKTIAPHQLRITHIKGGMSNMLFLCELPPNVQSLFGETEKTLLRVYFNPETENRLVAESVIFTLLSERQLGPRLYGVFNEGRLEEFIVSSTLCTSDIRNSEMSVRIASKMAKMHRMTLPISKDPTYMFEAIERWFGQLYMLCPDMTVEVLLDSLNSSKTFRLEDLTNEYHLIKKALLKSHSPVAFCHNDLQEGNILLPLDATSNSQDLVIIDFEYASYNYRAFDMANHFSEWAIDYSTSTAPYFTITKKDYPTLEERKVFMEAYFRALGEKCDEFSMKDFVDEVRPFLPMPHFFWSIWSLVQSELSPVKFGFFEYAKQRLNLYYQDREMLLSLLKA